MLSKSLSHYPQFRFRDGEKRLWNPVIKKTFVIRPEERVRLSLVDYFLNEAEVPSSRIAFESPVKLSQDKNASRADIICYNQDFKPHLLAECKAPDIKLNEKAAIQIARYNQKINAPFLLISNGWLDFWFQNEEGEVSSLEEIPDKFQAVKTQNTAIEYWIDRAFIGEKLHPAVRKFAVDNSQELFSDPKQPVKYLQFDGFSPEFALSHYYRIFGLPDNIKIAMSLAANVHGGTRLNAVLNQKGANTAFFTTSLDLLAEGVKSSTEVHSGEGVKVVDLASQTDFSFDSKLSDLAISFRNLLLKYS